MMAGWCEGAELGREESRWKVQRAMRACICEPSEGWCVGVGDSGCARRVRRRKRRPWEAERGKWTDSRVEGGGEELRRGRGGMHGARWCRE
jgi:hypothetical protein